MRIAVVGSRSITDVEWVFTILDRFIKEMSPFKPTIVSGGAVGVDEIAKLYAKKRGYDFVEYLPYFLLDTTVPFTSRYFFIRNKQIVQNSDKVLAIWDGKSKGTEHTIKYAQKTGVPVMILKDRTHVDSK